jgi:hypothetical protein
LKSGKECEVLSDKVKARTKEPMLAAASLYTLCSAPLFETTGRW